MSPLFRTRSSLGLVVGLLALAACVPPAVIPEIERDRVVKELEGRAFYLRVALNACPLYGDDRALLLTDEPTQELDLVRTPGGQSVPAPKAERILAPGTRVWLREIQFPTGWTIAKRVVMTPRYHPWAILDLLGEPRPAVIVLSQTAASFEEVRGELERMITPDDKTLLLRALPPEQREAVLKKELMEGMSTSAAEMAWGLPDKKLIDRPAGTETWIWAGGRRTAFFQDDRLVRFDRK